MIPVGRYSSGGLPASDELEYASRLLTVIVLGAAVAWAASLALQGRLSAALRALSGRRP